MTLEAQAIRPSRRRDTVQITLDSGEVFEGPLDTPLASFADVSRPDAELPIVAAIVDGHLTELSQPVTRHCRVQWLDIAHPDGIRIYRRSLCFVLIVAARELYPDLRIVVDEGGAERRDDVLVADRREIGQAVRQRRRRQKRIGGDGLVLGVFVGHVAQL